MTNKNNPCELDGFSFLEFSSLNGDYIKSYFQNLGFSLVAECHNYPLEVWQQNRILFILNELSYGQALNHARTHESGVCAMGFRVKDKQKSFEIALNNGATPAQSHPVYNLPAIVGIGGSVIYFTDHTFKPIEEDWKINHTHIHKGAGLMEIDHLTHNVYRGKLHKWAEFYKKIFGFTEIRDFNIHGKHTGLYSQALTSPCGKIKIPLNESKDDKSQIEEFLQEYHGEGIQHIALTTDNIYESIDKLKELEINFLDTPNTYYEQIKNRLPWEKESIEEMQKRKILIDGGPNEADGILLQIFTENIFGPVFFEIIQRKGHPGFGEGNFQALYEAIERDQILRGRL